MGFPARGEGSFKPLINQITAATAGETSNNSIDGSTESLPRGDRLHNATKLDISDSAFSNFQSVVSSLGAVTMAQENTQETPDSSQDVPTTGERVEAPADNTQADALPTVEGPGDVETTVKDAKAVELAALAGLSITPGQSLKLTLVEEPENEAQAPSAEAKKDPIHPQKSMQQFWSVFNPEYEGMVTQVLPESLIKQKAAKASGADIQSSPKAAKSYDEAKADCIRAVRRIIKECQEHNMKYSDPHFDIERDLKIAGDRDCLDGLIPEKDRAEPGNVKRVTEMFKDPKFFEDGATSDDITQGTNGDCWFLSALSALCSNEALIRKVCVIQSQLAGVYGFVFHRDGEWEQCIVDDKLYLRAPAYDESGDEIVTAYNLSQSNPEEEYTRLFQTGSKALLFARSSDQNETWVPLLEKAFAKAHGDYAAINGGQTGEAIEDLTGGVTTEIYTTNILDKNDFFNNELSKVGKDFLFSCGLAIYKNWRQDPNDDSDRGYVSRAMQAQRQLGLVGGHAYAILATYEGLGKRLVKVRNPWGHVEWNGPWSDGSKEWTEGDGDWAKRLNHKFGDDGVFWMSYDDLLKRYVYIDRTRIFGPEWCIANVWTSIQVPWSTADYHDTKFSIDVPVPTSAVIVLSQLDSRYFQGLEGKYNFKFHFRVQKDDENPDDYLARSRLTYELVRSVNVEVELEKGTYTVLMKVEATDTGRDDVETVIRNNINRREKVTQIGMSYDLAHRKGRDPSSTEAALEMTSPPKPSDTTGGADPVDPARNPWNAATIVGLKVYSKASDLSIKVILPEKEKAEEANKEAEKEDEKTEDEKDAEAKKEDIGHATLDGDDPAKAALDKATTDHTASAPAEAATPTSDLPIRVDNV